MCCCCSSKKCTSMIRIDVNNNNNSTTTVVSYPIQASEKQLSCAQFVLPNANLLLDVAQRNRADVETTGRRYRYKLWRTIAHRTETCTCEERKKHTRLEKLDCHGQKDIFHHVRSSYTKSHDETCRYVGTQNRRDRRRDNNSDDIVAMLWIETNRSDAL